MATMAAGMDMMTKSRRPRTESVQERNEALYERQRAARRGPTPEVFFAKHIDNSRIVKLDDVDRTRDMRSFAAAMTVLFFLVMVFVWQHLSAIEIGYKIEAQKQQVEQLHEQNRQLRLTEAQLSDPGRIDQMARKLGLNEPQPGQVVRPNGADPNAPAVAEVAAPMVRGN